MPEHPEMPEIPENPEIPEIPEHPAHYRLWHDENAGLHHPLREGSLQIFQEVCRFFMSAGPVFSKQCLLLQHKYENNRCRSTKW